MKPWKPNISICLLAAVLQATVVQDFSNVAFFIVWSSFTIEK